MKILSRTRFIRKAPIISLLSESNIPKDVISLGQGVPFFDPPRRAIENAQNFSNLKKGFRYSTDEGIIELRNIVSMKLEKENGFIANPEKNIMITSGSNQGFINVILAITNPGDEVIIFSPTYFNYVMGIKLAGCKPIIISTDSNGYLPDVSFLENYISKKTKAIITISPNNPTGLIYPKEILKKINIICKENNIFHISDEVYEYFIYDNLEHISPSIFDTGINHTISLFSLSKSFGMSGYRIGFIVLPNYIYNDVLKVQDTIGICAPVPGQAAAIEALKIGKKYVIDYLNQIDDIRKMFNDHFLNFNKLTFKNPNGAMYFFLKLKTKNKSIDISKKLIEDYGVITIPGEYFDVKYPSLRVSFGNISKEKSEEGVKRLIHGLYNLL